jgi:hypothetical protein
LTKKTLNNFLLISGSGRNIGKTTLACLLIEQLSRKHDVVGIKISPHVHGGDSDKELFKDLGNARIFIEADKSSNKDSSRMLRSGASNVYYIECDDEGLSDAVNLIAKSLAKEVLVICESGALTYYFKPGFHILIKGHNADESKLSFQLNLELSNITISSDIVFKPCSIQVSNESGEWKFNY